MGDMRSVCFRFGRSFLIWFTIAVAVIVWRMPPTVPVRPWMHFVLLVAILWPNAFLLGYIPDPINPWLLGVRRYVEAKNRALLLDALAFIAAGSVPVFGAGVALLWRNSWYVLIDFVTGLLIGSFYLLRRHQMMSFVSID